MTISGSSGDLDMTVQVAWAILMTCGNMDDKKELKNVRNPYLYLFFIFHNYM
ncbi:MAG: hypothetical protein HWN67_19585 [Candidatus Helarchaeota archaeon]|nr:hypothetical protein [Candidatus Helarchaeota archaeon]